MPRRSRVRFPDVLCFAHQRWGFIFDRPHHLMMRFARSRRVFFVEEPIQDAATPWTEITRRDGVEVVVPHVSREGPEPVERQLTALIQGLKIGRRITRPIAWYFTPMALPWSRPILAEARATVYDCMDDLGSFRNPPARIRELEGQVERYRQASEDALQQLDWCIGYMHGSGKKSIARSLAKNRSYIRTHLMKRAEQPVPSEQTEEGQIS